MEINVVHTPEELLAWARDESRLGEEAAKRGERRNASEHWAEVARICAMIPDAIWRPK